MDDSPIFVCATTRAGTTLLNLMLGHHPRIAFAGELEWAFDNSPEADPKGHEGYRRWLETNRDFRYHNLRYEPATDHADTVRGFLRAMKRSADEHKPQVSATVHRHYEAARRTWPNGRFVHLVRDGRDVAASWIRLGWMGSAWASATAWRDALECWNDVRQRIPENQRIEIRFEDLIARPEETLCHICAVIGVEYSESMLDYWKDSTYDAVSSQEKGKWRRTISRREIQHFESVASDALERNGYELSGYPRIHFRPWQESLLSAETRGRLINASVQRFGVPLWLGHAVTRRLGPERARRFVQLRMNELINSQLK